MARALLRIACSVVITGNNIPFQKPLGKPVTDPIRRLWLAFNRRSNQGLMRLKESKLGLVGLRPTKYPWHLSIYSLTHSPPPSASSSSFARHPKPLLLPFSLSLFFLFL